MGIQVFFRWAVFFGLPVMQTGTGWGQDYPNKPVRSVTAAPGSSSDLDARLVAQGTAGFLGQQVIVDNRAAIVAAEVVSRAAPDAIKDIYLKRPAALM